MFITAFTVRPEWGWGCIHDDKGVENRFRRDGAMPPLMKHRGPVLVHAGALGTRVEHETIGKWMLARGLATLGADPSGMKLFPDRKALLSGGIIGIMTAVGYIAPGGDLIADYDGPVVHARGAIRRVRSPFGQVPRLTSGRPIDLRWHEPHDYGLLLVDPMPLPLVAMPGQLGPFKVALDTLGPVVAPLVQGYVQARR